jgi:hypothetical protein
MKKIFNMRGAFCGAVLLVITFDAAGQLEVQKQEFFKYPFRGWVADINRCRLGTNDLTLILAQGHGVLINADKVVQKEFAFRVCTDPAAAQGQDGQSIVFCRGAGFSPVYAVDVDGRELWTNSARFVCNVVRHPSGRFYICTLYDGVKILDPNGSPIVTVNEEIRDIAFPSPTTALTISAATKKGNRLRLDTRNEKLEVLSSFPIESGASRIVAYNWPSTNDVCYQTARTLICVNGNGKSIKQIRTGQTMGAIGAIVQDDRGEEYLALMAAYKPIENSSKLFILRKNFEIVHEEMLPISGALTTLGTTNRLFVGNGTAGVFEYRLHNRP